MRTGLLTPIIQLKLFLLPNQIDVKKAILLLAVLTLFQNSFGQQRKKNNQIGLSIPLIMNNTKILNVYSGARAEYLSGNAISYGININYSLDLFKSVYAIAGFGYFKQSFGVERPFDFNGDTVTNFLYYTKKYSYGNINWLLGLGYKYDIDKNFAFSGSLLFNGLHSIKQLYTPTSYSGYQYKNVQSETNSFSFGQMVSLNIGAVRRVGDKFSIGSDLVLPVYTHWRKDNIFRENNTEYYHSKFGIGLSLSVKYQGYN